VSSKQAPLVVHQCKTCPWKVTTIPERDIPNYSIEEHEALRVAIRSGLDSLLGPSLHRMDCHSSMPGEGVLCAGWLHNQLGPGNNVGLRFAAAVGEFPVAKVVGEQHERFEDTLPRMSKRAIGLE